MNIREISKISNPYFEINREERNYVAILYSLICQKENLKKFLFLINRETLISNDFSIYFEYAYLRDLWKRIENEETKKHILRSFLKIKDINKILDKSISEINTFFGVFGKVSKKHIQYPGNWSIQKFKDNFKNNEDFIKVCKFKWAFNIKPDIVIQSSFENAICIEAKYKSVESKYPNGTLDKEAFKARDISPISQIDLQNYLMKEILGFKTKMGLLSYQKVKFKKELDFNITWKMAFSQLNTEKLPFFAKRMIENISK